MANHTKVSKLRWRQIPIDKGIHFHHLVDTSMDTNDNGPLNKVPGAILLSEFSYDDFTYYWICAAKNLVSAVLFKNPNN